MNIKEMVRQMTLSEKADLLTGEGTWFVKNAPRFGLEKMMMSDGPHGLRKQEAKGDNLGIYDSMESVCFPSASAMACSFDRNAFARLGETLGNECAAENIAVLLGPGINMKRSPLCGRNFEYLSEDPYLAGELAAEYVKGVQSKGIGTSVKHFAANNQEYKRMLISSVVDERTLREIYLSAFEIVVKKAKPWTVMCSYNKINGVYASENDWLLNHVLRGEWGYDGFVVTDWGASNDRIKGLKAGNDLEMPTSLDYNTKRIIAAVEDGSLAECDVDRVAERILNIALRHQEQVVRDCVYDREADHHTARELAAGSMVLLKNDDSILPLKQGARLAFIGEFAEKPRYQGGGSSHINAFKVTGALEAAREMASVTYAQGYRTGDQRPDPELTANAVEAARSADAAVVFVGLTDLEESEGYDRKTLELPVVHNAVVAAVAAVQPNTVVVLHAGAPVRMPWLKRVKGVLCAYLGGEAVGEATADILFGEVCPSGKLAETYPLSLEDTPCAAYFPGNTCTVEYREGPYIGYRYYDTAKKEVLFEFGYGLSYTTFEYRNLKLGKQQLHPGESLTVELDLVNRGACDGAEIVQIYVQPPEGAVYHPVKTLRGFEKVWVRAGETVHVSLELEPRSFEYYHTGLYNWQIQPGLYWIHAAASSRDIRLSAAVEAVVEEPAEPPFSREELPSYYSADIQAVSDAEFERLLGTPIPEAELPPGYRFTVNDCLYDARHTRWGKRLIKLAEKICGDKYAVLLEAVVTAPIRAIVSMAPEKITPDDALALVALLNRDHPYRAVRKLAKTAKRLRSK